MESALERPHLQVFSAPLDTSPSKRDGNRQTVGILACHAGPGNVTSLEHLLGSRQKEVGSCPPFSLKEGMKPTDTITQRLWSIIDPVCTSAGYELIDTAFTQSPNGWVLRVFIDHPPGDTAPGDASSSDSGDDNGHSGDIETRGKTTSGHALTAEGSAISLKDCTRMSRELGALLDVENPIDRPYSLEVSSPGLDRPLRHKSHFRRYLGQQAKVTLKHGIDGRRNFKGILLALEQPSPDGKTDDYSSEVPESPLPGAKPPRDTRTFLVMSVDGNRFRLPFDDIDNARLVPDWNSLFQRGGQQR